MAELGTLTDVAEAWRRKISKPQRNTSCIYKLYLSSCGWHREFEHLSSALVNGIMNVSSSCITCFHFCLWDNLQSLFILRRGELSRGHVTCVPLSHEAFCNEARKDETTLSLVSHYWSNIPSRSWGVFRWPAKSTSTFQLSLLKSQNIHRIKFTYLGLGFCSDRKLARTSLFTKKCFIWELNKEGRKDKDSV
jgi:hypothetical protein